MGTIQTGLIAFEEFANLPDPPGGYYEVHHGQVVFMPSRKQGHAIIQEALSDLLKPRTRGKGFLTIEFPFRPAAEYEAWQADVAFVTKERWEKDADYFFGAPDLVIEVLSPSKTKAEILERQETCLSNGCIAFWTVDPKRRLVRVTGTDRKNVTYDCSMPVPLPDPLGGSIPVSAIFEDAA
ncbi:MAG: Uma2 family endonuclease [Acidobacteriia bacterium]|nr:Uma2 family endonuclease [Terriglobia bacterium]